MMNLYREHALDGATAVDLVVALYDGVVRFLTEAMEAVERGKVEERRYAVKRALDIIIHLQARLRMDIGGRPAQALSEFYAAIFAAGVAGGFEGEVRARHSQRPQCARGLAAGGHRSRRLLGFADARDPGRPSSPERALLRRLDGLIRRAHPIAKNKS